MPLTQEHLSSLLAPLSSPDPTPFFAQSLSPRVKWTYGSPGATHELAGTYEGLQAFVGGTWGRLAACFDGPLQMEILSTILDSSSNRAAVEIRTTGKTKSTGQSIDNVACWLMTVDGEGAGQLSEITSYVDSAFIVSLLEASQ